MTSRAGNDLPGDGAQGEPATPLLGVAMKQTRAVVSSALTDQLELRWMRETDRHFVLSSWVRSYASKSTDARDYEGAAHALFSADYAPVVRDLVDRSIIVVACLKAEPDTVIGWLAVESGLLHYALVKPRWRRLGVARWMLKDYASLALVFTHRTSDAVKCPIPAGWVYRRFRIWPAPKESPCPA